MTMKLNIAAPVGALAALALAGCAANTPGQQAATGSGVMASATTPATERACFRVSGIRGQKIVDRSTVLFRTSVGPQDVFRMDMRNACLSTVSSDPLVLIPSGGSDIVCNRMDLDVKVASPIGATPCLINEVRKLTVAEVAALPNDQRP
ncbi:DUF6491 family protein [Phenylobacterium sp.]|uniref:DUF6491 family protein n=1 Tax=Phenylobacterium sp. TaxID=1871053 RepID=UPI00272EF32D|nr:DUF6491 family protein [Phenylobacterium sp.]MDP1617373.1 DUF6491 family protein [Phenylobacterium sp.]MDP1989283.1 DUF6491 family protein [Phenylobacterium sp.]